MILGRKIRRLAAIAFVASSIIPAAAAPVAAAQPATQTYFICPTTSLNNARGHWVIGGHGAYYVNVPVQGSTGGHVYLTVPVQVFSKAQIPAGWGLYKDLATYPNYETNSVEGPAMILAEGITRWLGGAAGFSEGDMVSVAINADGTSTVTVVGSMMTPQDVGDSITIQGTVPLASGVIW
ncbi:MAG: hypothetical protein U0838_02830 [Chloroflexota bacterium]